MAEQADGLVFNLRRPEGPLCEPQSFFCKAPLDLSYFAAGIRTVCWARLPQKYVVKNTKEGMISAFAKK